MSIASITLYRFSLPLTQPYKLALGVVNAFDTVLCVTRDADGNEGYGEATILTGYTPETIDDSWAIACGLAKQISGMGMDDAGPIIQAAHLSAPFTSTAMMTALEMCGRHPLLDVSQTATVPLLAIINASNEDGIVRETEARLDEGFTTLKVKVGFEVEADMARVRFIQNHLRGRALIRLDGNQGYAQDEALRFCAGLEPAGIELLEQPCHADDWDAAAAVAEVATVPMMLDESIYGPDDIDRAAELGAATYIKLKLMKAGGLGALADGLAHIRNRGMTPVLGNGVASDVGCWMEACTARTTIDNAGEMNGFLKPETGIFETPLAIINGSVVLPPGAPALKPGAMLSTMATATYSEGG
ncbi:MAG: mandelate racemase [Alphaproteobacteria bacterium]|jgi:L-Ala-D/L-Glu epimerase|nr:mandelate racemase [Alphaproteobacteria bacterium]MBT7943711.1 mandelate racemase [Alphaproteobacteria bacterium]